MTVSPGTSMADAFSSSRIIWSSVGGSFAGERSEMLSLLGREVAHSLTGLASSLIL